ncbi:MAG: hypothetical protein AAFP70_01860 [Calditrichota bacterium]
MSAQGVKAQTYPPAAEYASLLGIGFYNQNGGFMVDKLQLVFPPTDDKPVEFVITKADGSAVVNLAMRIERWNGYPAFAGLRAPSGHPGIVRVEEPGDYIMTIKVGGEAATSVPFSMKVESSGDPFNPRKNFMREGPWSTLGFLGDNVDKPDSPLLFYWWSNSREFPAGTKAASSTVHIMRNGKEVAVSSKAVAVSGTKWRFLRVPFKQKTSSGEVAFTKSMLVANNGDYDVVVKVKGKDTVIKTFKAQVKDGVLQRSSRCELSSKPNTDFISPRLIDMRDGYGGRNFMVDAYWVTTD